jgi:hypothetical protein
MNLDVVQWMVWESGEGHTVVRFGPTDDDRVDVKEKPEELIKAAKK